MKRKMLILLSLLLTPVAFAQVQAPCTNEDAYQTKGIWAKQKKDDLMMADVSLPKAQYPTVLLKAQTVIELLKKANPQFTGLDAFAGRSIRGNSYTANGAVPFGARAMYFSYYCVPDTPSYPKMRGQINQGGETETKVEVHFNSLGWLDNGNLSLGKHLLSPDGEIIFYSAKETGAIKGLALLQPGLSSRVKDEAVVITRRGSSPFIPVTREQFLRSLEISQRAWARKIEGDGQKVAEEYAEKAIAKIKTALDALSSAERQTQAIIRSQSDDPEKLFVTEAEGGRRLVTIDRRLFDERLPRQTIQLITIYWSWEEKNRAKVEMIRQFKQNFDFKALAEMIGK